MNLRHRVAIGVYQPVVLKKQRQCLNVTDKRSSVWSDAISEVIVLQSYVPVYYSIQIHHLHYSNKQDASRVVDALTVVISKAYGTIQRHDRCDHSVYFF